MAAFTAIVRRRLLCGVLALVSSAAGAQMPTAYADDPARRIAALEAEVARLRSELARLTAGRSVPDWGDSQVHLPRPPAAPRHRPPAAPGAAPPPSPLLAQSAWPLPATVWPPALIDVTALFCPPCAPCALAAEPARPGARP